MPDSRRLVRVLVRVLVVAVLAAAGVAAWLGWPRFFPPPTAVASTGSIRQTIVATGRVAALTEVTLANGIPGRIKSVLVKEGDLVEVGQPVILFDDHEIVAEVRAAEARVETARAELAKATQAHEAARARWIEARSGPRIYEIDRARAELAEARQRADNAEVERARLSRLLVNDYISRSQHDAAQMEAQVGKARVRAAEEALNLLLAGPKPESIYVAWTQVEEAQGEIRRAEIRVKQAVAERDRARSAFRTARVESTINGRVTKKLVEPGEAVDISMPLLVIGDVSKIIVKADVDETDLGKLQVGQRADVTADAWPGRIFPAVIYEIGQAVGKRKVRPEDPAKIQDMKVLETKLEVGEGATELKLGMTVDVTIHVARKDNVLVIPRSVVGTASGREAIVSVLGPNGAQPRRIALGMSDAAWIEVTAGLTAGEQVVVRTGSSP